MPSNEGIGIHHNSGTVSLLRLLMFQTPARAALLGHCGIPQRRRFAMPCQAKRTSFFEARMDTIDRRKSGR